jgi:glucose/arabinose dehydrogenase
MERRPLFLPFSFLFFPAVLLAAGLLVQGCLRPEAPTAPDGEGGPLSTGLAVVPPGFSEVTVVSGLASPTAMAMAPDGRIFVCEKGGRLRVVKDDALLPTPFLSVSVNSAGERGLLGVALDPDFAATRHVYVYYTASASPRHNRLSRFTASASNPDVAEAGSEVLLLRLDNLGSATNHNGGAIRFGADGKLYVAVGDNAAPSNAQSLSNLFGKMLRIDKDGGIPADNPFYGSATGKNRAIWALGLRNPFTFAVQPGTGRIFINDVGWMSWEEIDEGGSGRNYGWPGTEGPTADNRYTAPFHAYRNNRHPDGGGQGCAITGAAFYNPATIRFPSDYVGDYFFGDYCGGYIRRLDLSSMAVGDFITGIDGLTGIQVGDDGHLYYLAYGAGLLRRVSHTGSQAPVIGQHPADATAGVGGSATFTVSASGAAPLAYQWQRDGADIGGASSASYTLYDARTTDHGARFRCVVTNASGSATSDEATLTVTTNQGPTAVITAPAAGSTYQGGQVIRFSGTGSDPEDGDLPASRFTWQVDFHHDTHTHPMLAPTAGFKTGSVTVPTAGETSDNVWIRIYLTVTDAGGLTHRAHVDVQPVKANVTLATNPPGLQVKLDGTPFASPHAFTGVAGITRSLEAVSPQSLAGKTYEFVSWSDGGEALHSISTPAAAATYTATFREIPSAGVIVEAESGIFEGAEPKTLYPGYTGTGYVKYQNYNSWVEVTHDVAAAGPRSLELRYAIGYPGTRSVRVYVNGTIIGDFDFPDTGSWSNWGTVTVSAPLSAGENRIRVRLNKDAGMFLDHVRVL